MCSRGATQPYTRWQDVNVQPYHDTAAHRLPYYSSFAQVNYLKAQLASEQVLRGEVETALTAARSRADADRLEARTAAAAAEDARRAAVAAAGARAQSQLDAQAGEVLGLESKVRHCLQAAEKIMARLRR